MDNCIFCKIGNGAVPSEKLWEDDKFIAFLDINPINPGHTLIIPKGHVENVFAMGEGDYAAMFAAVKKLSGPIQKATGARRIGLVIEGFLVPHAHVHIVPLNHGGELSFSRAKKAEPGDLMETGRRIRHHL
ncbi:HIT domain-containing protein [Candidatus Micrarchaeota archaeon]|nr:HIT domain-containing protein [Candidatus Micrarchaeota archaeon]